MEEVTPAEARLLLSFRVLSDAKQEVLVDLAERLARLTDPQRVAIYQHLLGPPLHH